MFGAVVVRQLSGRGPPIWALFVAGAFATLATGVLSAAATESVLANSAPTLAFLFALFLFASALEAAGALDHLARWSIGLARRPRDLPFFLFVGIGLLSALIVNDALVLIGVPVVIGLATRLRIRAKPLLLVLAFSVTVGSVLTPFGNPQNLLVAVRSGVAAPVATFLRYLALPTAIDLLVGGWYLGRVYRDEMPADDAEYARARSEAPALFPLGGWRRRLLDRPVLWVFPATMAAVVVASVASAFAPGAFPASWEIALAGAVVLVVVSSHRAIAVQRVNWSILLLFAGLFVVVEGAVVGGVIASLESYLPIPGPGHLAGTVASVVGTSVLGSQLVSNVPWVALQLPLLSGLGYGPGNPVIWMALAAGSTLAGNVTLLGAMSNLILVDAAEKRHVSIRLPEFVRHGLPLALITVAVLVACLTLGL